MAYDKATVQLRGNIGADPESRSTADGKSILSFSLATNERWTDDAGERQERVDWHPCVAFGPVADALRTRIAKGKRFAIEGKLRYDSVTQEDGSKRKYPSIVVQHADEIVVPVRAAGPAQDDAPSGDGDAAY